MVQFGRLPSRKPPETKYDPYTLVPLVVNGLPVHARPLALSAVPVDANSTNDRDGNPIYPIECVTTCPQCGDALTVPLGGPVTAAYPVDCLDVTECRVRKRAKVAVEEMPDPFHNPFLEGLMSMGDVDAGLVSVLDLPPVPSGTVAGRRIDVELEP